MLINIGETFLEVDKDGKRKIGGDFGVVYQSYLLSTPSYFLTLVGDDKNGVWLQKEMVSLYKGALRIGMIPRTKTIVATEINGRYSYTHNHLFYFDDLKESLDPIYNNGDHMVFNLSSSLLREEGSFKAMKKLFAYKKRKKGAIFAMNFSLNDDLLLDKKEEVIERFKSIVPYLDVVLLGEKELSLFSKKKDIKERFKEIPYFHEKIIFYFRDGGKPAAIYKAQSIIESYYDELLFDEESTLHPNRDTFYATVLSFVEDDYEMPESSFATMTAYASIVSRITSGKSYLDYPSYDKVLEEISDRSPLNNEVYEA